MQIDYTFIRNLANSINHSNAFRKSFEDEIKDEKFMNTIDEYFDCLENISKRLTYICVMDSPNSPNVFGKLSLKLRKITKQDKKNLINNLVEYNGLKKAIEKYFSENINSVEVCYDNFNKMHDNIKDLMGCSGVYEH